jgi:hypothetical protein
MPHLHVGISEAISRSCNYEYSAFDYHHIRIKRPTPFYIMACDLALVLFQVAPSSPLCLLPAPTFHAALPSASSLSTLLNSSANE